MQNIIEINVSDTSGRFVRTTDTIGSGQIALSALPYASVICEEWTRECCWHCFSFSYGQTVKIRCLASTQPLSSLLAAAGSASSHDSRTGRGQKRSSLCKVRYCSLECAERDWIESHGIACEHLCAFEAKVRKCTIDFRPSKYERDLMRLVINALSRKRTEETIKDDKLDMSDDAGSFDPLDRIKLSGPPEPTWRDLMELQSSIKKLNNEIDEPGAPRYSEMFPFLKNVIGLPHEIIGNDSSLVDAVTYRELANSFGVWDAQSGEITECNDLLGFAVYPLASYFNHSCDANLEKQRNGRLMQFRALRDVVGGGELNVSYGYVNQPVEVRRARLRDNYYFDCMCTKCLNELESLAGR